MPVLIPRTASGLALPGLFRGPVAVTDDGQGVAEELIALLRDAGADTVRWDETAGKYSAVIFLGGLRPDRDDDAVTLEAFRIARALAGSGSFVTVGRLGRAGPGALARTCAREWPETAVRAIEVECADGDVTGVAAAVAAELLTGDSAADIVVRADGSRAGWAMVSDPAPPGPASPAVLDSDSVVVITGGGRGVTAACARALAHAFRPRIALVGRTALTPEPPASRAASTEADLRATLLAQARRDGDRPRPAAIEAEIKRILAVREVRATLAGVAAAGSPVRYLVADVTDVESLGAALREIRDEWGPVTGLVHGAGVLADRLVTDKTEEQFERVMRVKVAGLRNLLALAATDEPALVCVFSSVAASAGNAGQCDYAAANEIAERIALDWRSRHPGCLVKAIAWGPWHGGMVSAELAEVFGARNVPLIPLAEGAAAFVRELTVSADQVRCLITAQDAGVGGCGPDGIAHALDGGGGVRRGGELEVSEVAQVWVADHRVGDRAVVPLAVAVDWMLRLVDEPGPVVMRHIDVVRGIAAPAVVTVRRSGSAFTVATSASEPCFRANLAPVPEFAEAAMVAEAATDDQAPDAEPQPTGLVPFRPGPIYDGETLFHGPSLRVVRRIEGVGAAGAVAQVVGTGEMGWPEEPWRTDPGALDGAIQLAVLWARERLGRATLPMFVRQARLRAAGLETGPLRCVVRAVSVGEQSAICDVRLVRPDGTSVAALDGLELVARPR